MIFPGLALVLISRRISGDLYFFFETKYGIRIPMEERSFLMVLGKTQLL